MRQTLSIWSLPIKDGSEAGSMQPPEIIGISPSFYWIISGSLQLGVYKREEVRLILPQFLASPSLPSEFPFQLKIELSIQECQCLCVAWWLKGLGGLESFL